MASYASTAGGGAFGAAKVKILERDRSDSDMDQPTREAFEVLRTDLRRHQDQDREDFKNLRTDLGALTEAFQQLSGALNLMRWLLGLGIPAIFVELAMSLWRGWGK